MLAHRRQVSTMFAGTAEESSNRFRQEMDFNINLRRLNDLYSIFAFAFFKEVNQGCISYVRSQWTTLWYKLQEVQLSCDLEYIFDEDITEISMYITFILQFLDDLLSDDIVKHESKLSTLLRGKDAQPSDKVGSRNLNFSASK